MTRTFSRAWAAWALSFALVLMVAGAALPPATATAQSGSDEADIMAVIQQNQAEQVRATATRDATVLQDTSSDNFYQDISTALQAAWDGGLTGIQLVSVDWGDISVDGDLGTATTTETWSVSLANGQSIQAPPQQNVYGLVRVNDTWLIYSVTQPNSLVPASVA